jgi:hypothetical protein
MRMRRIRLLNSNKLIHFNNHLIFIIQLYLIVSYILFYENRKCCSILIERNLRRAEWFISTLRRKWGDSTCSPRLIYRRIKYMYIKKPYKINIIKIKKSFSIYSFYQNSDSTISLLIFSTIYSTNLTNSSSFFYLKIILNKHSFNLSYLFYLH